MEMNILIHDMGGSWRDSTVGMEGGAMLVITLSIAEL